ncbi:MAG: hypothetical protein FE78DRAFT_537829 [Acidomyces sp. 'richmondensis']|nr:MAG: hypothetical protein FE78DRAFT_537829 [Acidomyces sp. 'richmondensis']
MQNIYNIYEKWCCEIYNAPIVLPKRWRRLLARTKRLYNRQIQKSKRIFTTSTSKEDKLAVAGQDGNREWIDGTYLSPTLIYKAASDEMQGI